MHRRRSSKYVEVVEYLRVMIRRDGLKPGELLPSDHELCAKFSCSRGTVRYAMTALAREGLVERRQGAGTFVGKPYAGTERKLLAAIIPNITNTEFAGFVETLGFVAREKGYQLILSTGYAPEVEQNFIEEIARLKVSGVVKFPTNIEREEETRGLLRARGIPYVIINDFWTNSQGDYHVTYDECAAARMAVEHLVGLGHQRIVLVDNIAWGRTRLVDAFFKTLASYNLPHDERHLFMYDLSCTPPVEKLYGEEGPKPTALITIYGVEAPSLIMQLRKYEIWVPRDVSVVSLSGKPAMLSEVDLTSALPPNRKMVDRVLDVLINGHYRDHAQHYIYQPEFHVGATSGPCREEQGTGIHAWQTPVLEVQGKRSGS